MSEIKVEVKINKLIGATIAIVRNDGQYSIIGVDNFSELRQVKDAIDKYINDCESSPDACDSCEYNGNGCIDLPDCPYY